MELITVQSSNISQIGYEKEQKITFNQVPVSVLRIVFMSGITYDFYDVPKDIYEGLIKSSSKGQYFHQNIKTQYPFEKKQ